MQLRNVAFSNRFSDAVVVDERAKSIVINSIAPSKKIVVYKYCIMQV